MPSSVLILGCGETGIALAGRLASRGVACVGVRRSACGAGPAALRWVQADISRPEAIAGLRGPWSAVVLAATPGLRRGRDNGLLAAARLAVAAYASVPLIYTSSTSVYGDAGGGLIDEHGPLAADPASQGLLAVEEAVRVHPSASIIRVAAIVGPGRSHARDRARSGGPVVVKGDPDRPFSYVHEADLARVLDRLIDRPLAGTWNLSAPSLLTVRGYYEALAGRPLDLGGDGSIQPSRRIDGRRLDAALGIAPWLAPA